MLKLNDARNFRRAVSGVCLILAPLAFGGADVIRLYIEGGLSGEEQLSAIAANSGLWAVVTILNMVGLLLFVPAILGLMHLLRERSTVLSHVGGGLALVGVLGFVGHNAGYFGFMGGLATSEMSQEQMLQFVGHMETSVSVIMYVLMFLLGFQFGPLLLGIGLYRTRVVPRWTAGLVILGMVLWIVAGFTPASESMVAIVAVWILFSVGLGSTGLHVLAMSDTDWEKVRVPPAAEEVSVGAQPRVQ